MKLTHFFNWQDKMIFPCMFYDSLWKSCVSDYFSNVKYQDLCATINSSKIKDLEDHSLQEIIKLTVANVTWIGTM